MQRHLLKQIIATLILSARTTAWASAVIHIDKIEKIEQPEVWKLNLGGITQHLGIPI